MPDDLETLKLRAKAKLRLKKEREGKNIFGQNPREINSTSKAIALGSVEAVPGLKQGAAALETVPDVLEDAIDPNTDVSLEGVYEGYKQNLEDNNEAIQDAKKNNPVAFGIGEFGTTAVLSAAIGPLNIARQTVLGAAQGFSREHSVSDALWNGGMAGFLGALGVAVPKGIDFTKKTLAPKLANIADETSLTVIKPRQSKEITMKTKALIDKRYKGDIKAAAKDVEEIVDLPFSQNPSQMADRALENKNLIGKRLTEIIDDVDEEVLVLTGGNKTLSGGRLQAELKNAVDPTDVRFNKDHLDEVLGPSFKEIDDVIDSLTINKTARGKTKIIDEGVEVPISVQDRAAGGQVTKRFDGSNVKHETEMDIQEYMLSAKDVYRMKVGLAAKVEDIFEKKLVQSGGSMSPTDRMVIREQKARIVGKLSDVLDDQVSIKAAQVKAPTTSTMGKIKGKANAQPLIDEFRALNRKYGMASHVEQTTREVARSTFESSAFKLGEAAVSFKGIFLAGAGAGLAGPPGFVAGVVINHLMKHPSTPIKIARGMRQTAKYMADNPTSKIASNFTTAFAGQVGESPEAMQKLLDNTMAQVHLTMNPIERNKDDVISKANSIASLLRAESGDETAKRFLDAVETGDEDTIGTAMAEIEQNPDTASFIESGRGWNGKAYTEQSKTFYLKQVENSPISLRQKLELKKKLNLSNDDPGEIPQIEKEVPRALNFIQRNKQQPRY